MSRAVIAVALSLAALSGCGTISNLDPPQRASETVIPEKRFAVYGGVRNDIEQVKWVWNQPGDDGKTAAPLVALDIPLSLIGDTLTLPVTVTNELLFPIGWLTYGDEPPRDPHTLDRWRRFWFESKPTPVAQPAPPTKSP